MMTGYLQRKPQLVWLIVLGILVAGFASFVAMPRLEDPLLKRRVAVVSVSMIGADAGQIESTAVMPIEEWLNEFSDVKKVRSNIRANVANIVIELADSVDRPAEAWSAIERKLQSREAELPDSCSPIQLKVFPLKAFAAIVAIVPESSDSDLSIEYRVAKVLQARLLELEGTESVEVFGKPNEALIVQVAPQTLFATGLSTGNLAQQIQSSEVLPAGNLNYGGQRIAVDASDEADLLTRIENLSVDLPGRSDAARLGDLASVVVQNQQPPTDLAIIDGRRSVVVGVMVDESFRVDLWTKRMQAAIADLRSEFAGQYSIRPLFLQAEQIQNRMQNLTSNLAISTAAVMLVIFLLMGWRCMLVIGITLPLTAAAVIVGLRFLAIPIHQMSVTGLIVSLGLLIDNAIVVVDEVRSRIYAGKSRTQAVAESIRHLCMPLLGSTTTTVLTFLPIATMPGPSGEFVGSLAISVILAIVASLLLAFTVVPPLMLFLGVTDRRQGLLEFGVRPGFLGTLYQKSLEWTFRWPVLGVLSGLALPVLGFLQANKLERNFFPASDRPQVQLEVELSSSSNLVAVEKAVNEVSKIVRENQNVRQQHWFLGRSAPTFYYNVVPRRQSSHSYAQAFIDLKTASNMDDIVNQLQAMIDDRVLDARVIVRKLEQGPPFDAPVEIRLYGDDLNSLERSGNEIRQLLADHPAVVHTRSDLTSRVPELKLQVDQNLAQRNDISAKELSQFLFTHIQGADAGSFYYRGQSLPVIVKVDYADGKATELLSALSVTLKPSQSAMAARPGGGNRTVGAAPQTGELKKLPLGAIGSFELTAQPGNIIRINGRRVNEIKAYLKAGVLASSVFDSIKQKLADEAALPIGYDVEFGGEAEKRNQAISTLVANVVVIVAIMVLILVGTLGTIRMGLIIAAVGGLTLGLGPLALFSCGLPLGFMAIVGTMGLVGVAINDSIVVLAAIRGKTTRAQANELDERLADEQGFEEVVDAKELSRIVYGNTRHILATTLTTILGFLPLVLFGGKFWPPLAIVFCAGVGGATLLALYFTPSLYLMLHRRSDFK